MRRSQLSLALLLLLSMTACDGSALRVDSDDGGGDSILPDGGGGDDGDDGDDGGLPADAGSFGEDAGDPLDQPDAGLDAGPDAGQPDGGPIVVPPTAQCAIDDDCTGARRCHEGSCRTPCLLGTCFHTSEDDVCSGGFCVECVQDDQCPGTRYTCDLEHHRCQARHVDTSGTRIGIFYSLWHCPFASDNPEGSLVHDISEVLAGNQQLGPPWAAHWWDEPEAGYYCLSRNDALLHEHATRLAAAGIEFVFFDATNHAYVDWRSDRTRQMILEPLDRLLAVWSTIPGAPKVVPWVPVVEANTNAAVNTIDAIIARLDAFPELYFVHDGAPLILVTENENFVSSEAKLAALATRFTVRRMWAHQLENGPKWSFMDACQDDPAEGGPCRQRIATHEGALEQVSITTAYQLTYMSVPEYAVPKHAGLTFRRQFQTLFDNPDAPIATITGWNEWLSQLTPCGQHHTCPCESFPNGCFLDQYDLEYSRDIEPGRNERGDFYYRLLTSCIDLYRTGWMCDETTASELCCSGTAP